MQPATSYVVDPVLAVEGGIFFATIEITSPHNKLDVKNENAYFNIV
jgi:hypothetical protein